MTVPLLGLVESNLGSFKFVFSLPAAAIMTTFLLIAYCTALHSHREVWSSWRQSAPGELRKWQMRNQVAKQQQGACMKARITRRPPAHLYSAGCCSPQQTNAGDVHGSCGLGERARRPHRLTAVKMAFCAGSFLQANSQGSV